ncbi:MAG: rRNA maturation RNase YbeY [Candidatus Stahlbacteria bacterium]|nr:rRNA maturation RNase YbeY [Candidatus Stahlbacteria bacterium]
MLKIYIKSKNQPEADEPQAQKKPTINEKKLKSIAIKVFELENVSPKKDYEVSITLIDDKQIQELNKKYRAVDAPTDVISFTIPIVEAKLKQSGNPDLAGRKSRSGGEENPKFSRKCGIPKKAGQIQNPKSKIPNPKTLGDIYISLERASQQIVPDENLEKEVQRLLIHGLLHLLGYDHSKEMTNKQENYLNIM